MLFKSVDIEARVELFKWNLVFCAEFNFPLRKKLGFCLCCDVWNSHTESNVLVDILETINNSAFRGSGYMLKVFYDVMSF